MPECAMCRDVGWVLDGDPSKDPLALELLACPIPDCRATARPIELLTVNEAGFATVTRFPLPTSAPIGTRIVMSVGR